MIHTWGNPFEYIPTLSAFTERRMNGRAMRPTLFPHGTLPLHPWLGHTAQPICDSCGVVIGEERDRVSDLCVCCEKRRERYARGDEAWSGGFAENH